jgi:hypothetical protein
VRKVVICGSFHRDGAGLKRIFRELEATNCRVLSPLSIIFENISNEIVRTKSELSFTVQELEKFHLRAITEADFVWLHCPGGHVGLSGSFEAGFATALNIPLFSNQSPSDAMLKTQIKLVSSVFDALEQLQEYF